MGVQGLLKFLRDLDPRIVQTINLIELEGGSIAIDIAVLTYSFKSRYITKMVAKLNLLFEEIDYVAASEYMLHEILCFFYNVLKAKVMPVGVLDGQAPYLKDETKGERISKSENTKAKIDELRRIGRMFMSGEAYQLTNEEVAFLSSFPKPITTMGELHHRLDMEMKSYIVITLQERLHLKSILEYLGIPCIQAPSEAEFCCAEMCKRKDVTAVYTVDSDALMYGCPIMINKLTYMGGGIVPKPPKAQCYTFKNVMEVTGMTPSQFTDFCILCGTDFNSNCEGLAAISNFELIKTYGSIRELKKAKIAAMKWLEENPNGHQTKEFKMLMKFTPETLRYEKVVKFITTPTFYDPSLLKITIHGEDHAKYAKRGIQQMVGKKFYDKFLPYLDKILAILLAPKESENAENVQEKLE